MPSTAAPPTLDVRLAADADLDDVIELERLAFPGERWPRDEWERLFTEHRRGRRCIPGRRVLVATVGELLAGVVVWKVEKLEVENNHFAGEIILFAVHPDFRRLLVGTALFVGVRARTACLPLWTHTHERAVDAQLFLKALGFVAVGQIEPDEERGEADAAYLFRLDERLDIRRV